jgi:hypothetical protein
MDAGIGIMKAITAKRTKPTANHLKLVVLAKPPDGVSSEVDIGPPENRAIDRSPQSLGVSLQTILNVQDSKLEGTFRCSKVYFTTPVELPGFDQDMGIYQPITTDLQIPVKILYPTCVCPNFLQSTQP